MRPLRQLQLICFDFGDTLADEGTEIKDQTGVTLEAKLIPGAADVVRALKARGYPLALVADGLRGTYVNVLSHYGLWDLFDAAAISEEVGVEKPDARMFRTALDQLGIPKEHYGRTVMVGNNLERDIRGANMLGMVSVWLDWAPRRSKVPEDAIEVPDYTIKLPLELMEIIQQLENNFLTDSKMG
ncbi:MAG TPA: HAD family hydrolase [Anaerolineales bacterium]|nr:HAD family hydrolase [Anaerolineales bacterium]